VIRLRRPRTLLALVTLAVVVDLLAGMVLAGTGVLTPEDRGDLEGLEEEATAQMMANPIVSDEPWAAEYAAELAEFQASTVDYVPYLIAGYEEFHGQYLNTTAQERLGYRPPVGDDPVRIAVFGGSVVFGLGQRDEHTVPSELARLAEADGLDVEVHNYGFPRWVAWQEAQYLERVLTHDGPFDLVVFLDGFNELFVQAEQPSTDPTHHAADALQPFVRDFHEQRETSFTVADGLGELVDAYHRASAVWNLVDRFTVEPVNPLGPADGADQGEIVRNALEVYARSVALATDIAEDHGADARFFWQPQRAGWPAEVLDGLPPSVTDVSGAFDGRQDDVYLDPVHTDEVGAHLLAEAMWAELRADVRSAASSDP
jgi:hypothetical protein